MVVAVSVGTFEQAAQLDGAELRALLESDHPERRVWAIWALALRKQGVSEIAQRAAIEHNPGVRRAMAVVLASHGEVDLLVALARHDPALVVRASAMQLVTRLAAGGAIAASVVIEAARREPEIQIAILSAIAASPPAFVIDIASHLVEHGTPAVQAEAFELLARADLPASTALAIAWLSNASDERAADGCRRWLRVASPEVVARRLASSPPRVRSIALRELRTPSWPVVEELVGRDLPLLLDHLKNPAFQPPLRVLAQLVLECPGLRALEALLWRLRYLERLPPELSPLEPDLRRHCQERLEALRVEREAVFQAHRTGHLRESYGPDPLDVERDELEHLLALLDGHARRFTKLRKLPRPS